MRSKDSVNRPLSPEKFMDPQDVLRISLKTVDEMLRFGGENGREKEDSVWEPSESCL